jgi:hypothetical protein
MRYFSNTLTTKIGSARDIASNILTSAGPLTAPLTLLDKITTTEHDCNSNANHTRDLTDKTTKQTLTN